MSSKVQSALHAREEIRKKEQEEKQSRVTKALAARESNMQSSLSIKLSDWKTRINAENEAYKKVSIPSWDKDALRNMLDATRQNTVNVENLKREIKAYRKYIGDENVDILLSDLNQISDGYNSLLSIAERISQVEYENEKKKPSAWQDTIIRSFSTANDNPVNMTFNNVVYDYRNDDSYMKPNDNWSVEEKRTFGNLYMDSPDKAYQYAEETNNNINSDAEVKALEAIAESATSDVWAGAGHTVGAIASAPFGLADFLNDLAMVSAGRPITSDGFVSPFEYSQAVTEGISTHLNTELGVLDENIPIIGGKGVGDVYGLGTSIAQSMASAYTLGSAGTLISYFGQGAASGVDEALSRGASDEQAILYGTSLGVFEGLAEMVGVDKLFKLGSSSTVKGFIKNILNQAGAEGAEEGLTALFSNIADNVIMQDKSNFNALVAQYMAQGMSESEAKKKAWMDSVEGIAYDTIAGAISGGVSGGVHTTLSNISANKEASKTYGNGAELVSEALDIDPNSAYAQKMQAKLDKGKSLSGGQINRLVEMNEQGIKAQDTAKIKSAVEARLTELGETGNVSNLADIIVKAQTGGKLTAAETAILAKSKYGQRVSNELNPQNIESGEYSSKWAESIGTERINTEAYNKGLSKSKAVTTDTANAVAGEAKSVEASESATAQENATQGKYEVSEEGKTKRVSTGEDIVISGVESVENGAVKVRLESGDVVDASDVAFSTHDEAFLYEMVTRMGDVTPQTATALIKNFKATDGVSVQTYFADIPLAYQYGKINYARGLENLDLTIDQRQVAFYHGRNDADAEVKAKQTAITEKGSVGVAENATTTKGKGSVRFEKGATAKTKTQKRAVSLAKHLAKAIGIDIVFYDATIEGTFGSDANGYFDERTNTIHLDLQNSTDDAKTIVFTMAHELTHFIKKWSPAKFKVFADFLMEQYGDTAVTLEAKMEQLGTTDADLAYEEMICDACETMLLDSNAVVKLMQLRATDLTLFEKIKMHLLELLNKIRTEYKKLGLEPTSDEAKALLKMEGVLEKLSAMFEEAAVDAVQNYQAVENSNETVFGKEAVEVGEVESGVKNQLKAHKEIGEASIAYNDRHKAVHKAILQTGVEAMYEMAETMLPYLEEEGILPPDIPGKTIFKNGSYGRTGENTTLCVRTLTYEDFKDRVAEKVGRPLTVSESLLVSQKIYDIATEPQCIYCYVAADRKAYDDYLGEYHKAMDKYIKAMREGGDSDALYAEYLAGRKDTNQQKKRWSQWEAIAKSGKEYISAKDLTTKRKRDTIIAKKNAFSEQIKDAQRYAQSASWAKTVYDYRAYKGEILKMTAKFVDVLNSEYGLRMYSFSDYTPAFIVENMQMIIDASVKGLKSLAYTKDTDYVEIFASTGQAINVSCFAKWDAEAGTFVEDNRQGANWEKTKNLRKQYRNVGAVMVATNDAMVEWALKQDWVDVVIPYHIVKTGTTIANEYQWNNYTSESADRIGNKTANIYPTEHNNDFATYSNLLKERGITPRFSRWYDMVADGTLTEDQYMKLVNEVRLPASELSPVVPKFNLEAAKKSFGVDNEGKVIEGGFVDKGGYMGGWYRQGVDVNQEVMEVSEDIKAGKSSLDVDYGMSKTAKEKVEQRYKKQAKKSSMSNSVFTEEEMLNIRRDVVKHFNLKGINGFEQVQRGVFNTLKANGFFESNGERKVVIKENGMEVTINRGSIEETFGKGNKYESAPATFKILKLATIEQIPSIIESANVIAENEKNKHNNGENKTFTYLSGTATIEGKSVPVRITLKISKEKNKFWVHHVDVTKNTDDIFGLGAKNASPTDSKLSSAEDIITQTKPIVKKQIKKTSDKDSLGNDLSEEQKEFFKDSVVRDSKGNLLVVYHGTTANFNTFKKGDVGFHFGTKGAARGRVGFGKNVILKEVYLNITNPIVFDEDLGSWDADYRLTRELFDKQILTREEAESVLFTDDRKYKRSTESANKKLASVLLEKGYDGIAYQNTFETKKATTSYIVFNSNQAKETTNKTPTTNPDIRYQKKRNPSTYAPTFYSQMGREIDAIKMDKIGASSLVNYLKGKGIKHDEIKWSGIEAFLEGKKSVTKAELQEFIAGSQLEIVEQVSGEDIDLRYDGSERAYTLYDDNGNAVDTFTYNEFMGGYVAESDEEIYSNELELKESLRDVYGKNSSPKWADYKLDGGENYREIVFQLPDATYSNRAMKVHWGQDAEGVLVHARIQDMTTSNGKKMLFIEELQSDWHNEGHEKGYSTEEYEDAVAVYDKLAEDYANKRRAFNKYVRSGEFRSDPDDVSKKKFDWLRRKMDEAEKRMQAAERDIEALKEKGMGDVQDAPFRDTYHEYVLKRLLRTAAEEGYDAIGWTPSYIQSERWSDEFAEGYRIEYDQDMPKFLRKYGKKWGATVGKTSVSDNVEVWSMDITESMEQSVLYEGQVKFQKKRPITPISSSDYTKLENHFGTTTNYEVAGYLLKNGKMLDFSGKHWGNPYPTSRDVDHRDIWEVWENPEKDGVDEMVNMIGNGNIRLMPEVGGINLAAAPNEDQIKTLTEYIRHFRGEVIVDVDEVGGDTIHSFTYNRGTAPMAVIRDIMSYFEDGVIPQQQPEYRQFLYQKKMPSNRTILANTLESAIDTSTQVGQNELRWLKEYQSKIDLIEKEEAHLAEVKAEIAEISFNKGTDRSKLNGLNDEKIRTANRINTYDKQLTRLEAMKPIKDVLEREKEMVRKRTEQKWKEKLNARREKEAETQRELLTRWQESRKNAVEGRHKTEMRHKIKGVVSDLNKLLLDPTKDKHVPIGLQRPVAAALDIINMDTVGADERVAKYNELIAKSNDPVEIERLTKTRDRIQMQGENLADKLTALKNAYAEFKESDDPLIRNAHNEAIENLIAETVKTAGNTAIRDMSLNQLEAVYDMYKAILATVRNANKMFKADRQATVSEHSEAVKVEVREVGGHNDKVLKSTKGIKSFVWELLKPISAFKHIGSKTLSKLFGNVRAGEDTYARDLSEAKKFFTEQSAKYHYNSWDFKKRYTFKDITGLEFSLSLDQIMSLYAYSKRNQADRHLEVGGFVFDDAIEVREKNKLGIPVKYEVNDANPYRLNKIALGEITSSLTSEQKAFIDEMQTYLSDVMGAKGNEISLAMYDIKLYKEKHYFPLKTSRYFREFNPEQSGNPMLRNSGFSKKTVPQAGNPIVLSNFMEVWGGHVNDMSMYHSFVLPLEDFMRVYNYSSTAGGYDSVQQYIKNAYGSQANHYVEKLMQDINGGVVSGTLPNGWLKMFGKFKKTMVAASLSTIVQQPTAVLRAMAKINPVRFVGIPFKGGHKKTWEKIKQYAPVAIIKEMGGIDVGSGRKATDFITAENYKGLGKIKGFFTDSDYRDSIFMWGATKADELGWNTIWKAVEREVASEKKFKPNTEEFYKAVGERFTEVITETQVYDSVFSRSGIMRDKGDLNKFATSFMGEPITSLNMIYSAVLEAKRGGSKLQAAREIGSVYVSIVAASALASVIYALRDDDEDEAYLEKWAEAFGNKLSSEVWIHNMIPYIRDVASIIEGWDVERPDMSIFTDIKSSFDKLYKINEYDEFEWKVDFSDPASVYSAIENFGGSIASAFGLPVKNIMRETRSIFNAFKAMTDDIHPEDVKGAFGRGWSGEEKDKNEKLYEAIVSGDEGRLSVYRNTYKTEEAYETAVRSALREHDPRIAEAAQARLDGDIAEYARIAKEIIAEGNFKQDIVVGAINAEINAINKKANDQDKSSDDEVEKEEVTSIYKADDINSALESGDMTLAKELISELIEVKVANGSEESNAKSSIKSSITRYWKPLVKAAFEGNDTKEQLRIRDLLFDTGLYGKSRSEVYNTMKKWREED